METRPFDPVCEDPPDEDPAYPADLFEVAIPSGGARMIGVLLQAAGRGPHPTVLLLHGFPGDERNFDLAQILRRAGYNTLVFHYRGAWGSGGSYAFDHLPADVAAALAFLRDPATAARYRVDPARLTLIGQSLGGWTALMAAAADPQIRAVGALAFVNVPRLSPEVVTVFDEMIAPLQGTSAAALAAEMAAHGDDWDLVRLAPALAGKAVLLVGAARDPVAPVAVHQQPLIAALQAQGAAALTTQVLEADHAFSSRRIALARCLLAWLAQ
jgi:pimeloyl-ACP methyl ester carboxylesterase